MDLRGEGRFLMSEVPPYPHALGGDARAEAAPEQNITTAVPRSTICPRTWVWA